MGKIIRNYDNEGNLISKECNVCHEIKPISEFDKNKRGIDGLQLKCKECRKKYYQDNAENFRERQKKYRQDNAESIKEYQKEYYKKNAESIKEYQKEYHKEYQKEYYKKNAESIRGRRKEYYKKNAESIRGRRKEYHKKYYKEYYKNNAESLKEYQKEYRKDNIESIREYQKEYYKNNAEYQKEYRKEYRKEYNTKRIEEALQQIKTEVEKNPNKYNYIEDKEIYGIIYLVHNIESDKYYVGQTINSFDIRYPSGWLYEHDYKDTVKHDLQLYGINSFKYTKIFKVAYSQYELDKLEAYYINYYDSYENGYNENRGYIFSNRGKEDNK